ncbi:MAG: CPBP family intramembrane metalloprotease [Methanobrevibacter sp.]|nr:CPBP family intramembrane metalloprotease [Methanobrevibacter sp.]
MTEKSEFITFPKTFEKYKWYKPILVFIIGVITYLILSLLLSLIFEVAYGEHLTNSILNGGYEVMNSEIGQIFTDLGVIIMIPSLYIAVKIVKDRPFSSYASSRGGWNYKLYFKSLVIPFIIMIIFEGISLAFNGAEGTNHFSIGFFIVCLILVPLQCIAEEYVFRGLIMQTFGSWLNIPVLAVVLQSIVFGIMHGYNSLGNITIVISGLLMGILAWKSNGIEVSSAMHTANNLCLALFVMFGLSSTSSTIKLTDTVLAIAMDVIIFAAMYYVGMKTNWFGEIEN